MLIKFKDPSTKQDIMKKKSALKNNKEFNKVYCNEDLPEDSRKSRQSLRIIAKHANSLGFKNTHVRGNSLWHEGKQYRGSELTLLPDCLKLENIRTRDVGRGIGFFGRDSFLSNHHPARFTMNEHRFLNSEQAFFFYKAIICGKENTGQDIKKMLDPGEIKKLGEKVETCDDWEQRKVKVMKSVLTHKYEQNRDLREKLVNTGTRPLLECTTDLFWGTGWPIDSPKWNEAYDYPGENNLGKILEGIRENYLPVTAPFDPIPHQGRIPCQNFTSTPMTKSAPKSTKKRKNHPSQSSVPPAKQPVAKNDQPPLGISEKPAIQVELGDNGVMKTPSNDGNLPGTETKPYSTEEGTHDHTDAESVMETQETADTGAEGAECDPVEKEKNQLTESQVLEVDELTFSDTLYQSYDAKNVTNKDGSINTERIKSWGLPALNTSRLMAVTGYGSDSAREKLKSLLSAQNAGESYIEMDPHKATPVEVIQRKTLVAARQTKPESERNKIEKLLENV